MGRGRGADNLARRDSGDRRGWAGFIVIPQQRKALDDMAKAGSYSIWLDTVTNADVANAFLSGAEGIANGSQTPQQVAQAVQQAAAKVKKQS